MLENRSERTALNQPKTLVLSTVIFMAVGFLACGGKEEQISLNEINSVSSALTYSVPKGYGEAYFKTTGVECYQQGWFYPDYVCAVDLRKAHVRTMHGAVRGTDSFERKVLWDFWKDAPDTDSGKRKVLAVNTSFFNKDYNPTQMSFPYKRNGILLAKGADCAGGEGKVKNLHIWPDRQYAAIGSMGCAPADFSALEAYGSAPDIIGGLDTDYSKWKYLTIERTFFGVHDGTGDGTRETLLIYTSGWASQSYAEKQLRDFGADEVVMYDGNESTQLVVDGSLKISASRQLPNALVVYAP